MLDNRGLLSRPQARDPLQIRPSPLEERRDSRVNVLHCMVRDPMALFKIRALDALKRYDARDGLSRGNGMISTVRPEAVNPETGRFPERLKRLGLSKHPGHPGSSTSAAVKEKTLAACFDAIPGPDGVDWKFPRG